MNCFSYSANIFHLIFTLSTVISLYYLQLIIGQSTVEKCKRWFTVVYCNTYTSTRQILIPFTLFYGCPSFHCCPMVALEVSAFKNTSYTNDKVQVFWEGHENFFLVMSKQGGRLHQIFVTFSEHINFTDIYVLREWSNKCSLQGPRGRLKTYNQIWKSGKDKTVTQFKKPWIFNAILPVVLLPCLYSSQYKAKSFYIKVG